MIFTEDRPIAKQYQLVLRLRRVQISIEPETPQHVVQQRAPDRDLRFAPCIQ